ncbi:MAG: WD40 repeat domain-containing protein, partial [Verrucomicrobiaceae bacterium]
MKTIDLDGKEVVKLAWTEDSKWIAAGTYDGWLYLVSPEDGKIVARAWLRKGGEVLGITALSDPSAVIVNSAESGTSLWSLPSLHKMAELSFDASSPGQINEWSRHSLIPNGATILTSSMDGAIYAWNAAAFKGGASAEPALSYQPGFTPATSLRRIAWWDAREKV